MRIEIIEDSASALSDYTDVPIAFEANEIVDVVTDPTRGGVLTLSARRVSHDFVKDYDAIAGAAPALWANRFDVSKWGFFSAFSNKTRVGRAAVAHDDPAVEMLEGRRDLAVLWDIRVVPAMRRRGVGSALFDAVMTWAGRRGCRQLEIETQNLNVAACRFYAQRGCVLAAAHHGAYPGLPDEIQLLWLKDLGHRVAAPEEPHLAGRPA